MGANPMQKMKRNSILIGLTIGLIIGLILCGGVYLFLTSGTSLGKVSKENAMTVCVLNKEIKAGNTITPADVVQKVVNKVNVPADAVTLTTDAVAKIDLSIGTILGRSMLNETTDTLKDDLREQEYNMLSLPSNLAKGDFIDIRLQLPNGGDYIVVSKKQVINCNSTTVWLNMYEEEIDLMSNAIIEYYVMAGSKLYATKYTEPGMQVASVGTYVPNEAVAKTIEANPNIKEYINKDRYSDALKNLRNKYINGALIPYYLDEDGDGRTDALDNIEKNIQEEIKTLKEAREAYFGTLNAVN